MPSLSRSPRSSILASHTLILLASSASLRSSSWKKCLFFLEYFPIINLQCCSLQQSCRMVRKIPLWVYFAGPWNVKCWYMIVLAKLKYFREIWYILWKFVVIWNIFSLFGYVVPRKIWQPWYTNLWMAYFENMKNNWPFAFFWCYIGSCINAFNIIPIYMAMKM
jgi:hypothetical protein